MPDYVCIKIGENEPSTYHKFHRLSKHMDIIELLPRKRDKDGNLLNRGPGKEAEKHYLVLAVDMSHLSDEEYNELRAMLKSEITEDQIDPLTKEIVKVRKHKRKFKVDLTQYPTISTATRAKIEQHAQHRRNKAFHFLDMRQVNRKDKVIPFDAFIKMVHNKETGKYFHQEIPKKFIKRTN